MGLPVVISWFFVKHPAESIVSPALRDNRPVNAKHLAAMLRDTESAMSASAPPAYFSEQQAEKARRLAEKLDADARLAEATIQRERKRAELEDAERDFKEAQRKAREGR
jgi:AraC-like DNA-binding protein